MDVVELMKKELLRRKYSLRTINSYVFCLRNFLKYYKKEPRKISKKDISGSTLNVNL